MFEERVAANLEGVQFFSVGACPGCEECGLSEEPTDDDYDVASEPHFSFSACASCGSTLGGDRHPAHGVIAATPEEAREEEAAIEHFCVCSDCLMYHANGELPE